MKTKCIELDRPKTQFGYYSVNRKLDGKNFYLLHRYLYFKKTKSKKYHLNVLHKCNNASCINLDHLYLGDQKQNAKDSILAGTFRLTPKKFGSEHPNSRFSEFEVFCFKSLYESGFRICDIKNYFDLPQSTIFNILKNGMWPHV